VKCQPETTVDPTSDILVAGVHLAVWERTKHVSHTSKQFKCYFERFQWFKFLEETEDRQT